MSYLLEKNLKWLIIELQNYVFPLILSAVMLLQLGQG